MTPDYALQDALTRAFKAAGTAAGERVYDKVPANAGYPRIVFGPSQIVPLGARCLGASEVSQQVDVWSTRPGFGEVRQIAGALAALIDAGPLAPKNHELVLVEVESIDLSREPLAGTSRARIAVRAILQPAD